MTTTMERYSIDLYICSAYHKEFKEHVTEWFCVVSRLGYCVFGDSITQISNYFSDSTSTVNFQFISKSSSRRFLKHSFKCMRADAALRISELKRIKMRAKQRMRRFNACIAIKKLDQKSDASFDQPKTTQGNAESLTSPGPVHALEYTGSLSHVGPVTESAANDSPGPVHALEYTGSLSHVGPVTEFPANDSPGPVHALEYTGSLSHVGPVTESANESPGPVHALEYTGSLSHVGLVTESPANDSPGPVHALEYTGSLSHVGPVTESPANDSLGPVHALEYTGSLSHVGPVTESANDSPGLVHALECTGSLSHVGLVTESPANDSPGPVHALEYTGSLSHVGPVNECPAPLHALEYAGSPSHVASVPFTECWADDILPVQPHLSAGPVLGPTPAQSCLSAWPPALADLGFDSTATWSSA